MTKNVQIPYTLFVQLYKITADLLDEVGPNSDLYPELPDVCAQMEAKAQAIIRRQEYTHKVQSSLPKQ